MKINNHQIDLVNGQQPLHGSIYSLVLIEMTTPKAYIKTNLVNSFIPIFKSLAGAFILFNQKSDGSL